MTNSRLISCFSIASAYDSDEGKGDRTCLFEEFRSPGFQGFFLGSFKVLLHGCELSVDRVVIVSLASSWPTSAMKAYTWYPCSTSHARIQEVSDHLPIRGSKTHDGDRRTKSTRVRQQDATRFRFCHDFKDLKGTECGSEWGPMK